MSELETILRLVAEGHLTPDEAAAMIDALRGTASPVREATPQSQPPPSGAKARHIRIKVSEHGRQVVNLRIPLAFAGMAARMVPGISGDQADRIRAAIDAGSTGPIVDVEESDGDAVLITLE